MFETEERVIELHPFQGRTFLSQKRFVGMFAGTGGGKTFFGSLWMRREIQKYPDDAHLIIGPSYKPLQRNTLHGTATHPGFLRTNSDIIANYNEMKAEITLTIGKGIVYVGSADAPGSLEGCHVRSCWADEAVQMSRLVWIIMQARTGFHEGHCLFTTSLGTNEPGGIGKGFGWLHKDIYKEWEKAGRNHPDIDVIQFCSIDNPHYPVAEYERAEKALSPALFALRYRGQFARFEGMIYPEFPDTIVDPFDIPEDWERVGGMDFGYSPNPMATGCFAIDPKSETWYQYKEFYRIGVLLKEVGTDMAEDAMPIWWADPSGKREIAELKAMQDDEGKSLNLNVRAADNAVDYGIEKVQELQRMGRMKTFSTCVHTIDEAETYRRDENGKVIKQNDHCMDMRRYAVLSRLKHNRSPLRIIDLKEEN